MNRHFEDTLYYLKRAVETARKGVRREVEPVETKARELTGREKEPEPGRADELRSDLHAARRRVEGEVRHVVTTARERLGKYRGGAVGSN